MFQKLLVANRGEIACRILRTARRMGLQTVAVYSEADQDALHVQLADEAVLLGPAPANQSYLLADRILEAARQTGADCLHPGYGFLSEQAPFRRAVEAAGIAFIGPTAEAMEQMGSKLAAKQAVKAYNVPLVPGLDTPIADPAEAKAAADRIGYPVLIKASAGGGGKGMRIVEKPEDLNEALHLAQSEAVNAFGDGSVFLERYVGKPRHVEIQVLADHHGNVLYLHERECSIQRRHQKVIEEAPSAVLTPALRKQMGEAAVNVARACGYTNAGTVEFLVDENLDFFFLEMNTRLQVEHPVTECITGLDLVEWQLRVAAGEALPFGQADVRLEGHAIEARIYAEDAANNFLPDIGRLDVYRPPVGPGIRVDNGYLQGQQVPIHYDPLLAKLIVHAPTRAQAIDRMVAALRAYEVVGVQTTVDFCRWAVDHPAFRAGDLDTHFVPHRFTPDQLSPPLTPDEAEVAAMVARAWRLSHSAGAPGPTANDPNQADPWRPKPQR